MFADFYTQNGLCKINDNKNMIFSFMKLCKINLQKINNNKYFSFMNYAQNNCQKLTNENGIYT